MKNTLHFSKAREVTPASVGMPVNSGNGFYSYTYILIPYSGTIPNPSDAAKSISNILHDKYYRAPFRSLSNWQFYPNFDGGAAAGEILVTVNYHHGD